MAGKRTRLGAVQMRIMRILWERGRATAREITEELSRDEPAAHSTVQTLLRKLEAKGTVGHEVEDRTFVFHPLVQEEEAVKAATEDLLSRVFGGSAYGLVAHLLRNERITREEMARIRKLIKAKEGRR